MHSEPIDYLVQNVTRMLHDIAYLAKLSEVVTILRNVKKDTMIGSTKNVLQRKVISKQHEIILIDLVRRNPEDIPRALGRDLIELRKRRN